MSQSPALFKEWSGYLKPEDISQLQSAYQFSETAHQGQFRKSGEPYISHPLAVANILAQWHLDSQALTAALLHDVMEDTSVTKTEISKTFGKPVAELVDGVSKLDKIEFETHAEAQAENFRKMLLAMARDVRVILIKLADRLHNMRTLDAVGPDQRRRVARETIEIYAPIANRLGLNSIYQELDDLAFQHLYPDRYRVLAKAVKAARGNRREVVGRVLEAIKRRLRSNGIEAEVQGRQKHLYSIYRKMRDKHLTFAQVHDVFGFRIIVKDVPACYLALGALHGLYKPIPGKFKDYIAIGKANGYQSLHTALFGPFGSPIEIQIRTHEMHKIAEAGVASHWLYKSSDTSLSTLQKKTHQWLKSLLEMQSQAGDSVEFLEHLKVDLFPDEVYVFTPKGKIMALPRGSTAVDFAYAVHTDIGNRCVAVKINQELMPLRTELKNGDRVEIITAAHAKPNPLWLNFVSTGKARSRIRHFLKTMHFRESAQLGERLLNQSLVPLGANLAEVKDAQWDKFLRDTGGKAREEVLADIGLGKRLAAVVARRLLSLGEPGPAEAVASGSVVIRGSEGMAVQFAQCC
ncbi:MAG: bifunctional (p)ppGpp synthetase/guanosine-3',5'-bis(diphosphate) 3'-pyrophosphohydrolase, partial [Betaproteobacteria bacterium]